LTVATEVLLDFTVVEEIFAEVAPLIFTVAVPPLAAKVFLVELRVTFFLEAAWETFPAKTVVAAIASERTTAPARRSVRDFVIVSSSYYGSIRFEWVSYLNQ
jgi:uncharacterized protein (UPF0262 family)